MRKVLFALLTISAQLSGGMAAGAYTFTVKHEHFWGSARGELRLDETGISYQSEKDRGHSRKWEYSEIQELKIVGPARFRILTYQDVWWKLNSDRWVDFVLTDEEITAEVIGFLRRHLTTPLVSAVFPMPDQILYSLPAKHRHGLGGGCEGQLILTDEGIHYSAQKAQHSRFWPFTEIESLGQMSDFDLRITVRERGHFGSRRNFQFLLKRALPDEISDFVSRKIFEPESWLVGLKPE